MAVIVMDCNGSNCNGLEFVVACCLYSGAFQFKEQCIILEDFTMRKIICKQINGISMSQPESLPCVGRCDRK